MEDEKKTAAEVLGIAPLNITAQDVLNALFNADDTVCFRVFDDKKHWSVQHTFRLHNEALREFDRILKAENK